jgi:MFS superfamily sulfate permease-like transporter
MLLSRTAVNASSGVKTPMSGVVTGLLAMLCLAVLMPYCAFIPKVTN